VGTVRKGPILRATVNAVACYRALREIMFSKVRVRRSKLDYFKRKAKAACPLEIQAYLMGNVLSTEEIEITDFIYPKRYHTQTCEEVAWYDEDYKKFKNRVEREGKYSVGDIHTHPNYPPIMSGQDYQTAVTESSMISGICSVYGNRTHVVFWTTTSSKPCIIEYI